MAMILGTQPGSVTNHIQSRMTIGQPAPTVGMGATLLSWTDREAGTIVAVREIKGGWDIDFQEDHAKRTDDNGMSESGQEYAYTPNPDASKITFRFDTARADKGWRQVYTKPNGRVCLVSRTGGYGLRIGERRKYHDFSF